MQTKHRGFFAKKFGGQQKKCHGKESRTIQCSRQTWTRSYLKQISPSSIDFSEVITLYLGFGPSTNCSTYEQQWDLSVLCLNDVVYTNTGWILKTNNNLNSYLPYTNCWQFIIITKFCLEMGKKRLKDLHLFKSLLERHMASTP